MDISAHRRRSRRLSPIRSHQSPCQNNEFCVKLLEWEDWHVPDTEIRPNVRIPITFSTANHAAVIQPFDPDACQNPANPCGSFDEGYCVHFEVDAEWVNGTQVLQQCAGNSAAPPLKNTWTAELDPVPSPGTYSVTARMVFPGSGQATPILTDDVVVTEGGTTDPPSNGGGGNGNGGSGKPLLPCFLDPNRNCSSFENAAWLMASLFLLSIVLD